MGMDFLMTYGFTKQGVTPDWEAGKAFVATLNDEALSRFTEQATGEGFESSDPEIDTLRTEATDNILASIAEVQDEYENGMRNYLALIDTPDGYTLYLAGGMSWGDSPSEVFEALNNLWSVAEVMAAMGFLVGRSSTDSEDGDGHGQAS